MGFIIDNINNNIQYGKQNIIINTCKPMMNWRQLDRGCAIRSYKYKLSDESIYVDKIKFNQFVDTVFDKLPKLNLNKVSKDYIGNRDLSKCIFQNKVKYMQFDNIDIFDARLVMHQLLAKLGTVNVFNSIDCSGILVEDGNCEYAHNSVCPDDIVNDIRRNLIEKGIL